MKKKMISIAIFILVVFIGLGFFLLEILTPKVILLPSEEISFALNKEIIYISEEKDNILTISTSNEQFKKPSVNASDNCYFNVIKNAEKEIQLAFSVVSGAQVYFELRTENYETARVLYNVTSNEKTLAVEWLDEENNALIFETESNRNVMFIANQEHFSQAKTAGYICEIYIKCKINDIETNLTDFSITLSENLEIINNRILAKAVGNASVEIEYKEDSNLKQVYNFKVKNIPIEEVIGVPETIVLDLSSTYIYNLDLTILPEYATIETAEIINTSDVVKVENLQITALKEGVATIKIKIENFEFLTQIIVVNKLLSPSDFNPNKQYKFDIKLVSESENLEILYYENITKIKIKNENEISLKLKIVDTQNNMQNSIILAEIKSGEDKIKENKFQTPLIYNVTFKENLTSSTQIILRVFSETLEIAHLILFEFV